jgi:transcriptional regulator with XRE-family HTH domain
MRSMGTISATVAIGRRIRRLREAKGLSRNDLAREIDVDVSSISGWEHGKRLPRVSLRPLLARALDCELEHLMSPAGDPKTPSTVAVLDVSREFPRALAAAARSLRHSLRAVRLAFPDATAQHVLREARLALGERILSGRIDVQRVEIFYSLDRLKEALSNILRYDGRPYYVKACCTGMTEIAPFLGGCAFDDREVMLGTYRPMMPPQGYSVLHLRGPVIGTFFRSHWNSIWAHGTLINPRGARDLEAVRDIAIALGLPPRRWSRFKDEAAALEIGDGAPPLI